MGNFTNNQAFVGEYKTRFIWSIMEEMEIAATTPGPRELTNWELYSELIAGGTIPVVASNLFLIEGEEAKQVGQPYVIVERNGIKIALFGLMGGNLFTAARVPEGVEFDFRDPYAIAHELVPQLQEQADLVILLSQMKTQDTDRLIAEVPGIDVALYGNLAPWVETAASIEKTVCNKTGVRGQYLGYLVLIVDPDGNVIDYGSKNDKLAEAYPEKPEIAMQVAEVEAEATRLRQEQVRKQSEAKTPARPGAE